MSLQPLIKWTGGKEQELKYIIPYLPKTINKYFEPFINHLHNTSSFMSRM